MTQKQYQRAVAIYKRLDELGRVKEEIKGTASKRLTYSKESSRGWDVCWPNTMRLITEILNKHDLMIRKEIDEEIERLEKEIETL